MKKIITFIAIISLFSCGNFESPRSVFYQDLFVACGVDIIIKNTGCKECFSISSNKKMDKSFSGITEDIPGVSFGYFIDEWSFSFRINTSFNADESLLIIKDRVSKKLCGDNIDDCPYMHDEHHEIKHNIFHLLNEDKSKADSLIERIDFEGMVK